MSREIPESHRQVLAALARRPPPGLDDIDPDILAELRKWGIVMERSLEVTGLGSRYLGGAKGGVLE